MDQHKRLDPDPFSSEVRSGSAFSSCGSLALALSKSIACLVSLVAQRLLVNPATEGGVKARLEPLEAQEPADTLQRIFLDQIQVQSHHCLDF